MGVCFSSSSNTEPDDDETSVGDNNVNVEMEPDEGGAPAEGIFRLPEDVINYIFKLMPPKERLYARSTCKTWDVLISTNPDLMGGVSFTVYEQPTVDLLENGPAWTQLRLILPLAWNNEFTGLLTKNLGVRGAFVKSMELQSHMESSMLSPIQLYTLIISCPNLRRLSLEVLLSSVNDWSADMGSNIREILEKLSHLKIKSECFMSSDFFHKNLVLHTKQLVELKVHCYEHADAYGFPPEENLPDKYNQRLHDIHELIASNRNTIKSLDMCFARPEVMIKYYSAVLEPLSNVVQLDKLYLYLHHPNSRDGSSSLEEDTYFWETWNELFDHDPNTLFWPNDPQVDPNPIRLFQIWSQFVNRQKGLKHLRLPHISNSNHVLAPEHYAAFKDLLGSIPATVTRLNAVSDNVFVLPNPAPAPVAVPVAPAGQPQEDDAVIEVADAQQPQEIEPENESDEEADEGNQEQEEDNEVEEVQEEEDNEVDEVQEEEDNEVDEVQGEEVEAVEGDDEEEEEVDEEGDEEIDEEGEEEEEEVDDEEEEMQPVPPQEIPSGIVRLSDDYKFLENLESFTTTLNTFRIPAAFLQMDVLDHQPPLCAKLKKMKFSPLQAYMDHNRSCTLYRNLLKVLVPRTLTHLTIDGLSNSCDDALQIIIQHLQLLESLKLRIQAYNEALTDYGITGISKTWLAERLKDGVRGFKEYVEDGRSQPPELVGHSLSALKHLRILDLRNLTKLTDMGIYYGLKLPQLQTLVLCTIIRKPYDKLTDWGLEQLAQNCPGLEVVKVNLGCLTSPSGIHSFISSCRRLKAPFCSISRNTKTQYFPDRKFITKLITGFGWMYGTNYDYDY